MSRHIIIAGLLTETLFMGFAVATAGAADRSLPGGPRQPTQIEPVAASGVLRGG